MILRSRHEQCAFYHGEDDAHLCDDLKKAYDEATVNWFIKCEYAFMRITNNKDCKNNLDRGFIGIQIALHK